MALPRLAAVRRLVVTHLAHHRGQLSVYLRLLGVELPRLHEPAWDHHRDPAGAEEEAPWRLPAVVVGEAAMV